MIQSDVLILGGGISGVAAALSSASTGARTTLVRRGPGATALAAGGWVGAPPMELTAALAHAGLELVACDGMLPHPDGYLTRCDVAPVSHARAAISRGAERAIVCGIAGLSGFYPVALAALWANDAELDAHALEPVTLTLAQTPAAGWAPLSLAALLEREPQRIGVPLAHAARERGAARAILPPILGVNAHTAVLASVQSHAGVLVGESLAGVPSIPGWRLDRALLRALDERGVRVITGTVTEHVANNGVLQFVTVASEDGTHALGARAYVLATGKFIGGGISGAQRFEEAALGCDVVLERFGRTFEDPGASLVLTDPVRNEPQPVLALGVLTSDDAVPMRVTGAACFTNVVAAGSVRSGVATAALGLGAAAHDGWHAGARAATIAGAN